MREKDDWLARLSQHDGDDLQLWKDILYGVDEILRLSKQRDRALEIGWVFEPYQCGDDCPICTDKGPPLYRRMTLTDLEEPE